jgi:CrcB protein
VAWIAVAVGGALGSVARHGVYRVVLRRWPSLQFPLATLTVNVAGCFVIGLLAGLIAADRIAMRTPWRELVFAGVLGGFTTFSSFGLDTMTLVRSPSSSIAVWNVVAQLGLGLGAVYAGLLLGTS